MIKLRTMATLVFILTLAACDKSKNGRLFECIGYKNMGANCTPTWVPTAIDFGESQSIGYSVWARRYLYDSVDYRHDHWDGDGDNPPPTPNRFYGRQNDGTSIQLVSHMETMLQNRYFTLIVFNAGLHDLKLYPDGRPQVPLNIYRDEIEAASMLAKQHATIIIWADVMPVPAGALPNNVPAGAEKPYNEIADSIAKAHGFYILHMKDAQHIPHNIHYTADGSSALGKQVAECVKTALSNLETETCHH